MQTIDTTGHQWDDVHMETPTNPTTTYTPIDGQRPLSPRMVDVLTMHDNGMPNVDIADALGIAAGTVSNALNDALRRTGRRSDDASTDGMDIDTFIAHRIAVIDASIADHTSAIDALTIERDRITMVMMDVDA